MLCSGGAHLTRQQLWEDGHRLWLGAPHHRKEGLTNYGYLLRQSECTCARNGDGEFDLVKDLIEVVGFSFCDGAFAGNQN